MRQVVVMGVGAVTTLLASAVPLHGFGIVLVVALGGLDILLLQATGWLAFRRGSGLDERQGALRDLAYRRGFRWIGLAMGLLLLVLFVSYLVVTGGVSAVKTADVDTGITGRILLATIELLVILPTCVVAWREEDATGPDEDEGDGGRSRRRGWMAWLVIPGILAGWLAAVVWLPIQSAPHGSLSVGGGPSNATCQEFAGGTMIGSEFGATVGFRTYVCWNGTDAFVWGNPRLPLPPSALQSAGPPGFTAPESLFNPASPLYSGCGLDNLSDFAAVGQTTCAEHIDATGTLHYTVKARVSPLPFGIASREVSVELVVTRTGKVLQGQGFEQS
jgi:hypothetical protein